MAQIGFKEGTYGFFAEPDYEESPLRNVRGQIILPLEDCRQAQISEEDS